MSGQVHPIQTRRPAACAISLLLFLVVSCGSRAAFAQPHQEIQTSDLLKQMREQRKGFRDEADKHGVDDIQLHRTTDGTIDVNRSSDGMSSKRRSSDPTCTAAGYCWRWPPTDMFGFLVEDRVWCYGNLYDGTVGMERVSDDLCAGAKSPPRPY